MELALESWYELREISRDGDQLQARFVPDHFHGGIVDPVLVITVDQPANADDAVEKLQRFREESLVTVNVDAQTLQLWAEYDDEPSVIAGEHVVTRFESYSVADMQQVVAALSASLDSSDGRVAQLHEKVTAVESFVRDLMTRAQTKRSLTTQSTASLDVQIQLLERILRKFRDE